jgi:hypothetical protein
LRTRWCLPNPDRRHGAVPVLAMAMQAVGEAAFRHDRRGAPPVPEIRVFSKESRGESDNGAASTSRPPPRSNE